MGVTIDFGTRVLITLFIGGLTTWGRGKWLHCLIRLFLEDMSSIWNQKMLCRFRNDTDMFSLSKFCIYSHVYFGPIYSILICRSEIERWMYTKVCFCFRCLNDVKEFRRFRNRWQQVRTANASRSVETLSPFTISSEWSSANTHLYQVFFQANYV